ncbi:MAG: M23 family metallopeptidase [Lachnospiraceae bacterium]|nr:M23 family metallopeptidase [Lachnospiraceae bacterium]MBQ2287697.1 M23 family metallopeptidase [Lachnospiraceae bacterium]
MKERIKKFWKQNGFYTVLTGALVVVLSISGIAGYRSGIKDKNTEDNVAQNIAQNTAEKVSAPTNNPTDEKMAEDSEAANADVAETFGEEAQMVMPTEGDVLKPFSMDTTIYFDTLDQYKCNPAMLIKADVNQEVVASFGGKVESVAEDAVNGSMIIVDMGNGYKAIYGQMKDIGVKEGDTIVKGQVIGNVAQPTKYFAEEGSHLYFGMTKEDAPVNPQDYLEKES